MEIIEVFRACFQTLRAKEAMYVPLDTKPDILLDIGTTTMSNAAQKRPIKNYRRRLKKRGISRFEVLGLNVDRELIRSLASKLAQGDPEANRIRSEVTRVVSRTSQKGGILAALRRSPLVDADLKTERAFDPGRKIDL